jgi:Alpha/beta hydrolase domain
MERSDVNDHGSFPGLTASVGGVLKRLLTASVIAAFVLLLGAALTGTARAAVTSVSVVSSTELGEFDHRDYREVQIRMVGAAPGGAYDVPLTLAFPETSRDYSGVAVVDVVNTSTITGVLPAPIVSGPTYLARAILGDNYLFGSGHVYLSVEWDKRTVDIRQIGTIAATGDAFTIIRDAAHLARDPGLVPVNDRPRAARKVIAYGFSQTGGILRGFYHSHQNTFGGGLAFDGALYGAAQGGCNEPPTPRYICSGTVSDGGKVIAYGTETEAERGGFLERGETSDYRYFEVAGTAHVPRSFIAFVDAPNQNPMDSTPAARAALHNLIQWIDDGIEPPSSDYIQLESAESIVFNTPFRHAVRDADGNAVGGVRLPHMTATDSSGEIGAPLGAYEGGDLAQSNFFLFLGGHFTPFDSARLDELYPSHGAYVERVAKAAHRLVQRREILQEDAKAYIREAAHSSIGK